MKISGPATTAMGMPACKEAVASMSSTTFLTFLRPLATSLAAVFSAAGAGLMGYAGGGVEDKIREATEKTTENTAETVKRIDKLEFQWSE